jgi:purine-binding chemotaxis protein CheW
MAAYVLFTAAGQTLALPAAAVLQVLRMAAPAPAPGAPAHVRGILDVRGELFAVLDVAARLGAPPRAPRTEDRLLLVTDGHGGRVALQVEDVLAVRELPAGAFEAPPAIASAPLLAGALRIDDGVVLVHSPAAWLAEADGGAARSPG